MAGINDIALSIAFWKKLKNANFSGNAKKKLFDAASDTDKTAPSLIYLCEKNIFFAAVFDLRKKGRLQI